jgi:hypothetical protein
MKAVKKPKIKPDWKLLGISIANIRSKRYKKVIALLQKYKFYRTLK